MTDHAPSREGGAQADLQGLEASVRRAARRGPAPVHLWNPPYCGEIGLRIAQDGTWFYQNSPIGRRPLVQLFASILRKDEDGRHYLVTPVEKIGIDVDDVPFLAVEMTVRHDSAGQVLDFQTNVDDHVTADRDHPLRFVLDPENDGLKPYVLVRGRLEARLTRALYYDLVELAVTETDGKNERFGVWSAGSFFAMADADQAGVR